MPYVITTTSVRPNALTLLFADVMPVQQLPPLYDMVGFVMKHYAASADRLTITEQYTWNTQADEAAYRAADPRNNTPSYAAARLAYNTSNRIQETVSVIETVP